VINQHANPEPCELISGTITYGSLVNQISSFYCPGSGRIGFHRFIPVTISEYYSGNVSMVLPSHPLLIGGNFVSLGSGQIGEFSFFASK